jgi:glycosyltransferase involved in cell wall biosynthesis
MHLNTRQDYVSLAFAGWVKTPVVITLHFVMPGENDPAKQDRLLLLKKYKNNNFISISNAQRTLNFLNYIDTVYNGLDFSEFKANQKPENYLAWFGGIRHDKGTAEAIAVAKKLGMKLVIGGKIDWANEEYIKYYNEKIKSEIDGKQIIYIGELADKEKIEFLGKAKALLHPLNWNEPFGLVAIEAMACGTPVIAFDNGPVKEQIIEGKTGFIVKNVDEMAEAVGKIDTIDRAFCAKHANEKFSAKKMAEGYEEAYRKVITDKKNDYNNTHQ